MKVLEQVSDHHLCRFSKRGPCHNTLENQVFIFADPTSIKDAAVAPFRSMKPLLSAATPLIPRQAAQASLLLGRQYTVIWRILRWCDTS